MGLRAEINWIYIKEIIYQEHYKKIINYQRIKIDGSMFVGKSHLPTKLPTNMYPLFIDGNICWYDVMSNY